MTVGDIFGKRMVGFPVRKNIDVDVLQSLKAALLEMFEEGDIDALHDKWFKHGECWNNTRKDSYQNKKWGKSVYQYFIWMCL